MSKGWLKNIDAYGGKLMEYFVQLEVWGEVNPKMCIPSSVFWIRHVLKHAALKSPERYLGYSEHIQKVARDRYHKDRGLIEGLFNRAEYNCDDHLTTWERLVVANSKLDWLVSSWPDRTRRKPGWKPTAKENASTLNDLGYLLATNRKKWPDRVTKKVAELNILTATSFFKRFREYYCLGTTDEFQGINRPRVPPPFDELIRHDYLDECVGFLSLGKLEPERHLAVEFGAEGAVEPSALVGPADSTDTFSLICIYNARRVRKSLAEGWPIDRKLVGHMMAFRHGGDHVVFFDPNSGSVKFSSFPKFRSWFRGVYWGRSEYAKRGVDSGFVKRFKRPAARKRGPA